MYETFYGLSGKPFQLNPDPAFFFGSKGHSSAYSYLKYGVFQGEGFIVITGEIGAGKTTLVRTLLAELDTRDVVAVQLVSTQLEADDLLRAVATAFGLPVKGMDKAQLLATLEAFLTSLAADNKRGLLIVDEAQNLSPRAMEELRMLSNFQLGERALLQSFLIGQPELRNLLREPYMQQLRQRVIASYHLGPIDKKETRAYVEHRLHRVGWKNDPEIDAGAFDAIFAATGGVPRRINTLCNRLLLAGYLGERHKLEAGDVDAVAGEIRAEAGVDLPAAPTSNEPSLQDAARGDSVVRPFAVSAINARLDRLEKSIGQVLDLLRSMNTTDRRPTKPGRQARG
jgi:putative secretion ATPase (PEP-CTERM system associated)